MPLGRHSLRVLGMGAVLAVFTACSSSSSNPPAASRSAAERALCADLAAPATDEGALPEDTLRRLLADADQFDRAGDATTAEGIRALVEAERTLATLVREKAGMAIFLWDGATAAQVDAVRSRLDQEPGVEDIRFESKADAYARFKRIFSSQPELTSHVSPAALPASFRVRVTSPDAFDALADSVRSLPGVQRVGVDTSDASLRIGGLRWLPALLTCYTEPLPATP